MGMILKSDPVTKLRRRMHYHEHDDSFHVETQQDVSEIISLNKHQQAAIDERARHKDVQHVARIPMAVWGELIRQGIAYDEERLARWLDDPDNRHFRTHTSKLSKGRRRR